MLENGRAARPVSAVGSVVVDPVCVADGVTLDASNIGPNVSIAAGSVIRGSRLSNCIVGEDVTLVDCDLTDSLIGDHVQATGLRGTVSLGDHTLIQPAKSPA